MELDVKTGTPTTIGGLTLYPLYRSGEPAGTYLPGPLAADQQAMTVSELDEGAQVPMLQLTNTADVPVLLVEGEMLVGAKQNRTLNLSVLAPAAATIQVPVSCVEAGRWGRPRASRRSAQFANLELRRAKTASTIRHQRIGAGKRSDQGEVWAHVDRALAARQVASPTSALEDAFAAPDPTARAPLARPEPDQVGVVAVIEGRPAAIDLFDKPQTLQAYWDSIVAGYRFDAGDDASAPGDPGLVDAFLEALARADERSVESTGLGEETHFESNDIVGAALRWDDAIVHLSAYAPA